AAEPWGCLINSDGTDFEWIMRGDTRATFTQDSQKIVYKTSEGIFTRDFVGNIEQISSVSYHNYNYFSDDLQYLIDEDDNDIYRMNIDGSNRINLTETPDSRDYDSHISADGNWITYVSEVDTVYSIWIMDINGENNVEVITDSTNVFVRPKLNQMDNRIYYNQVISRDNSLKSINIDGSDDYIVKEQTLPYFIISGVGNVVLFISRVNQSRVNQSLEVYFIVNGEIISVADFYSHLFDIDYHGNKLVLSGGSLRVINLNDLETIEIDQGYSPSISPDGEKIFFIKDRELPIED
ncbi:MAG: DUF5050 domain-containing protein, partial [Candidatus Cloacimonadales bacterium]